MERLDKLLAATGRWSRREVKGLVKAGRVLVDGVPAAAPEQKLDPGRSRVLVDGEEAGCSPWDDWTRTARACCC